MGQAKKVTIVNPADIAEYEPVGSTDIRERRLLGRGVSNYIEIFWGEYGNQGKREKQSKAFDQSVFILEGEVKFSGKGMGEIAQKRDMVFIPAGVEYQSLSNGAKFFSLNSCNNNSTEEKNSKKLFP